MHSTVVGSKLTVALTYTGVAGGTGVPVTHIPTTLTSLSFLLSFFRS